MSADFFIISIIKNFVQILSLDPESPISFTFWNTRYIVAKKRLPTGTTPCQNQDIKSSSSFSTVAQTYSILYNTVPLTFNSHILNFDLLNILSRRVVKLTCEIDGDWSGPRCIADTCPPPDPIFTGLYQCSKDFRTGSQCYLSCPDDRYVGHFDIARSR